MDCMEFRRQCATEPGHKGAALAEHISECPTCAAFAKEMQSLDGLIAQALRVPLPAALQDFSVEAQTPDSSASPVEIRGDVDNKVSVLSKNRSLTYGGRLALAAGVIAAVLVSIGVWRSAPTPSLGSELVAHVLHEPLSLLPVAEPVSAERVDYVLRRSGTRVDAPLGVVSYVTSCPFRNQQVPHIVIEGSTGPVTLLLLPHVAVAEATAFEESGFKGTIVPVGKGSVAIIGSETEPLDVIKNLVSSAVAWQI